MAIEVTATELKNRAGQVLEQAQREDVIVKRQGRPYVAIIAWEDYKDLKRIKEQSDGARRRLTPERAKEIMDEFAAISLQGEQGVNLAEFIARDRLEH